MQQLAVISRRAKLWEQLPPECIALCGPIYSGRQSLRDLSLDAISGARIHRDFHRSASLTPPRQLISCEAEAISTSIRKIIVYSLSYLINSV